MICVTGEVTTPKIWAPVDKRPYNRKTFFHGWTVVALALGKALAMICHDI